MHPRAFVIGIALYLTLLLAGAAGLTLGEDWLEATPDVMVEVRALLAAISLVLLTAWAVVRARLENVRRRR